MWCWTLRECLLLQCLCLYSRVNTLYSLSVCCRNDWVVLNAAPRNGHTADVTCCHWTTFTFWFKLFPHCRHFIHRFASVTLRVSEFCHKLCSDVKKKQARIHVQNCRFQSAEKCPDLPRFYRSDQDIPTVITINANSLFEHIYAGSLYCMAS